MCVMQGRSALRWVCQVRVPEMQGGVGPHLGAGTVPWLYKKAVLDASAESPYLRTPQQILAARQILMRSTVHRSGVKARSGLGFVKSSRLRYIYSSRKLMRSCRWAHFVCDATSIGGKKWLQIVNWSVEKGVGFWCIPQAGPASNARSITQRVVLQRLTPPFCP